MDIQMPVMDGVSATMHIRNILQMDIPIIALTANASEKDEALYKSVGMNAYLAKPFKKEVLFNLILNSIKGIEPQSLQVYKNNTVVSGSLFSLKEIEEIAAGDAAFVRSIIQTFLDNTPNYMNQISLGIAKNNFEMVRKNAHQIKPSLDILCIGEGSKLIRIIEEESSKTQVDKELISNSFSSLKNIIDLVSRELYSNL
jgi:CheY-like chemotaxis protein